MTFSISKIAKLSCCIFLFYMFLFKYAFRQVNVILYGTAIIAVACMLVGLIRTRKDLNSICPIGVMINLTMCVYSVLTGLWRAADPRILISQVITYAAFTLVCMAMCFVSYEEQSIEWIISAIIIIDFIICIFVVFRGYYVQGYGYVLGIGQNPNTLGLDMDIGLFCLAFKTRKSSRMNIVYLMLAIPFFYIIVGCGSRKSLIGAVLLLAMWLVPLYIRAWRKSSIWEKVGLGIVLIAVVIGIIYFYKTVYLTSDVYIRMQRLGESDEGSSSARIKMYQYALGFFLEHPVFGIGFNQYRVLNPTHGYSHSTYAEALASWGAIGCMIYFIPVLLAGFRLIRFFGNRRIGFIALMCFILYLLELYLGIGQIWFYECEHLIAWTLIFLIIDYLLKVSEESYKVVRELKYVKA